MKFAVIGLGGRGSTYAHFIKYYGSEIVAVCDPNEKKRELAKEYGVSDDMIFTSEDEFFAKGKLADALVIATMDSLHHRQAIKALELGYHILLEKPIAMTLEECREIRDLAVKRDRRVVVCHVLRYSPMYMKLKDLLDEGAIGDVISVDMTENIGFYHYAHSYCRGNWRNTDISTPLIVAKNCHDTDMLCWLLNKNWISVSSIGGLKFFKKENAPEGSAERCSDCQFKDTCIYSAFRIYNDEAFEKVAGLAKHGCLGKTHEEINESLINPDNLYGRCVFHCDNNVADYQIMNALFEDGITVQFKTIAHTNSLAREIKFFGTKGMLYATPGEKSVTLELLYDKPLKIPYDEPIGGYAHHAGGDVAIVKQFIEYIETGVRAKNVTDITDSLTGHSLAFLAEESRLANGKVFYNEK
jgi:predicted dehydrogenase